MILPCQTLRCNICCVNKTRLNQTFAECVLHVCNSVYLTPDKYRATTLYIKLLSWILTGFIDGFDIEKYYDSLKTFPDILIMLFFIYKMHLILSE